MDGHAALFQQGLQRLDQIRIGARHQLIHEFNHGDRTAQRGIHAGHFQPDDAAAHHQQTLGHIGQHQRIGGIHDPRILPRKRRQFHRLRTGGDDALREIDGFNTFFGRYRQTVGGSKFSDAGDRAHLALLGHTGDALAERADGFFLVCAQFIQIDFRHAEIQTDLGHVFDFFDDIGGMQQGFRRDATDIQANAAKLLVTLDQNHVHAQIGGSESGGVTARTGTDDHQLALVVGIAFRRRRGFGCRRGGCG